MKYAKMLYLMLGFVAGISYLVACGGGTSSIADTIVNAIDVVYSNTTSGLSATNAQAAIDELATNQSDIITTTTLVGTWSLVMAYDSTNTVAGVITFNGDGTYTTEQISDPALDFCTSGRYVLADSLLTLEKPCEPTQVNSLPAGIANGSLYFSKGGTRTYVGTKQ